jgi:glyoxylase-like metal-dependent hydrolase (beta-lactamase superfamily II)
MSGPRPCLPGVYRLVGELGGRWLQLFLFRGEDGDLIWDAGVATTPEAFALSAIERAGGTPERLRWIVVSHGDVDHFGGVAALRRWAPGATVAAGRGDRRWIEDPSAALDERYGWFDKVGLAYAEETRAFLATAAEAGVRVGLTLVGGEEFDLGGGMRIGVLALPGHSPGHLGLWLSRERAAFVGDAVMADGLVTTNGERVQPPPYYDAPAYRASVARLRRLAPRRLYTAHFPPVEGEDAVDAFLSLSARFVADLEREVRAALGRMGTATLAELTRVCDERLGPFASFANELGGSVHAHLEELAAAGEVRALDPGGTVWEASSPAGE